MWLKAGEYGRWLVGLVVKLEFEISTRARKLGARKNTGAEMFESEEGFVLAVKKEEMRAKKRKNKNGKRGRALTQELLFLKERAWVMAGISFFIIMSKLGLLPRAIGISG